MGGTEGRRTIVSQCTARIPASPGVSERRFVILDKLQAPARPLSGTNLRDDRGPMRAPARTTSPIPLAIPAARTAGSGLAMQGTCRTAPVVSSRGRKRGMRDHPRLRRRGGAADAARPRDDGKEPCRSSSGCSRSWRACSPRCDRAATRPSTRPSGLHPGGSRRDDGRSRRPRGDGPRPTAALADAGAPRRGALHRSRDDGFHRHTGSVGSLRHAKTGFAPAPRGFVIRSPVLPAGDRITSVALDRFGRMGFERQAVGFGRTARGLPMIGGPILVSLT